MLEVFVFLHSTVKKIMCLWLKPPLKVYFENFQTKTVPDWNSGIDTTFSVYIWYLKIGRSVLSEKRKMSIYIFVTHIPITIVPFHKSTGAKTNFSVAKHKYSLGFLNPKAKTQSLTQGMMVFTAFLFQPSFVYLHLGYHPQSQRPNHIQEGRLLQRVASWPPILLVSPRMVWEDFPWFQ